MKLILLTNMPAYQQLELAQAFAQHLGADHFRLAVFGSFSASRTQMGWVDNFDSPYLLRFERSEHDREATLDWIQNADVVIQGRFPIRYVRQRIAQGGLTYAYQERIWKKGFSFTRLISRLPFLWKNYFSVNRANYHLLAAGRYAASDLKALGLFKDRAWKFGYFVAPKPMSKAAAPPRASAATTVQLVWVGRLLKLKRPQRAIELLQIFTQHHINAHLTLVGDGELKGALKQQAASAGLTEQVTFTGWQPVASVNKIMADAHIMLMSSDHREGWGVVINEAINNGCFAMVCAEVGSAAWLIRDQHTGIVYNDDRFTESATQLALRWKQSPSDILEAAQVGCSELQMHWSTDAAVQRLVAHARVVLAGKDAASLYDFGPCSPT